MHSALRVRDYVFDTVALRNAFEAVDVGGGSSGTTYTDEALYALFDYFCDWGPAREGNVNALASEELGSVGPGEREELFDHCCKELAENLREQYSIDAGEEEVPRLATVLGGDGSDVGQYDFVLDYLWRYSKHLAELDPDENPAIGDVQNLVNATRNLPSEFLETKEDQYSRGPVNRIRARLLEEFHRDGEVSVEVLEEIKTEIQNDEDTALSSWDNFTIVGQVYYDYFKPRLDHYLETLADRIVDEFGDLDLTTHIVNFQGARNFLSDFAWIVAYPRSTDSQEDSYQLYLGIHAEHLTYGLYVGDNLRVGSWKADRDVERPEDIETTDVGDVLSKLNDVESDFRRLENLDDVDSPVDTEIERPARAGTIARQLDAKKQVVFYGPPGTGKTYVAQQFAHWWIAEQDETDPSNKQVRTVTFHPSFTYEDFVEGLSAESTEEGDVAYEVKDGILKTICKAARADYQQVEDEEEAPRYVLVIDEINRGNLAQIFGETITLLEADKRGTVTTQLAHSGTEFTIPPNLYVVGTMNTADRSIALVDAALRRRFRFIGFPPNYDVLCDHHQLTNLGEAREIVRTNTSPHDVLPALSLVALQQINERILDSPDLGKGKQVGHSYLMNVSGPEEVVDAWKYDILPLLEEYFFGQFDRIQQDIFGGAGGELIDWEREHIRPFDAHDLVDALGTMTDLEAEVEMTETDDADGKPAYSKYPDAIQQAQKRIYPRVQETLHSDTVGDVSHNNYDRRALTFTSNAPDHPDDILYKFKPAPERLGTLRIGFDTTDDERDLFDRVVSNADLFEESGFDVLPSDATNNTFFVVRKDYELEDAERGEEGPEVVADLLERDRFDRAIDDFVDLIEITHRLFGEEDVE